MGFQHLDQRGSKNHSYKHDMANTPTYRSWQSMIRRVDGKDPHSSHYYVEKGIKVCKRWRKFENFLSDMGIRPEGRTLDRIDNDGDYKPSNCRWATPKEQSNNQRKKKIKGAYKNSKLIFFRGQERPKAEIARLLNKSIQFVNYRIKSNKLGELE